MLPYAPASCLILARSLLSMSILVQPCTRTVHKCGYVAATAAAVGFTCVNVPAKESCKLSWVGLMFPLHPRSHGIRGLEPSGLGPLSRGACCHHHHTSDALLRWAKRSFTAPTQCALPHANALVRNGGSTKGCNLNCHFWFSGVV